MQWKRANKLATKYVCTLKKMENKTTTINIQKIVDCHQFKEKTHTAGHKTIQ